MLLNVRDMAHNKTGKTDKNIRKYLKFERRNPFPKRPGNAI